MRNRLLPPLLALPPCIAFLTPLLFGRFYSFRDLVPYVLPLKAFAAREAAAGRIPWFNPYNGCGELFLTNPQTGVLYPPTYLFLLPSFVAGQLYLFLHLFLAAAGMFLLARAFGKSASYSLALGMGFGFSGVMLSCWDLPFNLGTTAWVPLLLWSVKARKPLGTALCLALSFLAGEPVLFAFHLVTLAVFMIVERIPARPILPWLGLGGLAVFGQTLWLFLGFIQSSRLGGGAGNAAGFGWKDLAVLTSGPLFGVPFREVPGPARQAYLPLPFIGTLLLFAALCGLAIRGRHRLLGIPAVFFLLLSMGENGPLGFAFGLPGMAWVRFPPRFLLCALPCLALLALYGERRRPGALLIHFLLLAGGGMLADQFQWVYFVPLGMLLCAYWLRNDNRVLPFLVLAELAAVVHPIFFLQDAAVLRNPPPVRPSPLYRAYAPAESLRFLDWEYPYGLFARESDARGLAGLAGYSNLFYKIPITRSPHPLSSEASVRQASLSAGETGGSWIPELDPAQGVRWRPSDALPLVNLEVRSFSYTAGGILFEPGAGAERECLVRFGPTPWMNVLVDGRAVAWHASGEWTAFRLPPGARRVEITFAPSWARAAFLISGGLWILILCYAIIRWISRLFWRSD